MAKCFGLLAFLFFLLNFKMYFIFLIIRKTKQKDVKISLVKFSRKIMKLHIPIGMTGVIIILFHILFVLKEKSGFAVAFKEVSGMINLLILSILLFSGLFRKKKATGFRRKFHYVMAFIFITTSFIHLLL